SRRHTRFSRDWSSDVCSSDLIAIRVVDGAVAQLARIREGAALPGPFPGPGLDAAATAAQVQGQFAAAVAGIARGQQRAGGFEGEQGNGEAGHRKAEGRGQGLAS